MAFGILDTQYVDLPANIDRTYLLGLQTRAGVSFAQLLPRIDAALRAANNAIPAWLAGLLAPPTSEVTASNGTVAPLVMERKGEYAMPRPQLAKPPAAVMLPIWGNEIAVGFTEDGLERLSEEGIMRQITAMVQGFQAGWRWDILTRLTSAAEVVVDEGTTATSPGFAGSGTGLNAFSATYPDGGALGGGYTHYYRVASTDVDDTLLTILADAQRWGLTPLDLVGPQAMIDIVTAINPGNPSTGFVPVGSALVRFADNVSQAQGLDPDVYLGVLYGYIRVRRPIPDWTTANIVVYKTYGAFNPRNPLAWRYDPITGRNLYLRSRNLYPLAEAVGVQKYGIGVNNRVAAYNIYVAGSGSYTAPTVIQGIVEG